MYDTSQVVAAVIGSNALFAFIQFLITRHDQKKNALSKHEQAQNDMIIGLGHDKLLYLTDKFVQRGGITLKERRNLDYIYRPFRAAGGNVRSAMRLAKSSQRSARRRQRPWTERSSAGNMALKMR